MKSILRGPLIPLVAIALLIVVYVLAKAKIVSDSTFSNLACITLLPYTAWEIWLIRENLKNGAKEKGTK